MFAAVIVTPSRITDGMPDADREPDGLLRPLIRPVSRRARRTVRMMIGTTTSGVDGCGRRDPQPRPREHAAVDVDDGDLDPAAADVDPDRERAGIRRGRVGWGRLGSLLHRRLRSS